MGHSVRAILAFAVILNHAFGAGLFDSLFFRNVRKFRAKVIATNHSIAPLVTTP